MHYQNVRAAKFIDRPNRFIAHVALDGVETLMGMMQLSTDRFNTYCLECVKTCCRGLANSSVGSVACGDG